ncbi:hypothetical protein HanHA300_Chr17g0637911 [Helianthus annuus]|nr:hypothetical protein HanHA300_Chr17g0637911 [Helianthus annuus]
MLRISYRVLDTAAGVWCDTICCDVSKQGPVDTVLMLLAEMPQLN